MIIRGVLRMSMVLNISDRTLRKIMHKHADFPVDKSDTGCWIFDTNKVLPWFKSHYGYLEGLQDGNLITANGLKKKLGVSVNTVTRWMHEGMPHQKVNQSLIVIDLAKATDWLGNRSKLLKTNKNERAVYCPSNEQNAPTPPAPAFSP